LRFLTRSLVSMSLALCSLVALPDYAA